MAKTQQLGNTGKSKARLIRKSEIDGSKTVTVNFSPAQAGKSFGLSRWHERFAQWQNETSKNSGDYRTSMGLFEDINRQNPLCKVLSNYVQNKVAMGLRKRFPQINEDAIMSLAETGIYGYTILYKITPDQIKLIEDSDTAVGLSDVDDKGEKVGQEFTISADGDVLLPIPRTQIGRNLKSPMRFFNTHWRMMNANDVWEKIDPSTAVFAVIDNPIMSSVPELAIRTFDTMERLGTLSMQTGLPQFMLIVKGVGGERLAAELNRLVEQLSQGDNAWFGSAGDEKVEVVNLAAERKTENLIAALEDMRKTLTITYTGSETTVLASATGMGSGIADTQQDTANDHIEGMIQTISEQLERQGFVVTKPTVETLSEEGNRTAETIIEEGIESPMQTDNPAEPSEPTETTLQ